MITDLKPHAAYIESGHEWLGIIPAHWRQLRAKCLFREVDERSTAGKEELLSVSHLTGVTPRRLKTVTMFLAASNVGHKVCRPGDLVINTLWAWMGALGVTRHTGIVSPAYGVYRPIVGSGILPAYADHLLRTPLYAAEYQRRSTGVNSSRLRLYPEQFLRIPVLLPPVDEQADIVRFLDCANGRLDRAIRAKRKVIALLTEQKQATIHRALTTDFIGVSSRKYSGSPSIGDIPRHWAVSQLRRLVKPGTMITYGIVQAGPDIDRGVPYIRTSDMKGYELPRTGYLRTTREIDSVYRRSKVETGDLVVAIRATLGKALLVPDYLDGANLTQGTAKVSPGSSLLSEFLLHAFNSNYCQENIRLIAKGTTFLEITLEGLRRLPLAVPPLDEQRQICDRLASALRPIQHLILRTERETSLLREYRTRLIADVVTGKLNVRDAAARLPNEAPVDLADDPDPDPDSLSDDTEFSEEEAEA